MKKTTHTLPLGRLLLPIALGAAFLPAAAGATTFSYRTCLGSVTGNTVVTDIEVTANGQAYATGHTFAIDFPGVTGASAQDDGVGKDAFVSKLDLAGNLFRSTYFDLDSEEQGEAIDLDASNNVVIGGYSYDGAGVSQAFVAKLGPALDTVLWSKQFGGSASDVVHDVAVDAGGNIFAGGYTSSANFCTTAPMTGKCTVKTTLGGESDAFLVKLGANGGISWATLAGTGQFDRGSAVAAGGDGRPYLAGYSHLPASADPVNPLPSTYYSWVKRYAAAGTSVSYSFSFGADRAGLSGTVFTAPWDLAVDALGNAYLTGSTNSPKMETEAALQGTYGGLGDAFVGMINNSGTDFVYNTYLGGPKSESGQGIRVGDNNNAYVAGRCEGKEAPDLWCTGLPGDQNVFVARYAAGGGSRVFYERFGSPDIDSTSALALDSARNLYVAGWTSSAAFDGAAVSCDIASPINSVGFVVKYP